MAVCWKTMVRFLLGNEEAERRWKRTEERWIRTKDGQEGRQGQQRCSVPFLRYHGAWWFAQLFVFYGTIGCGMATSVEIPDSVESWIDSAERNLCSLGSLTEDNKKELYSQQRALNARRKATQRLERLSNALTRKKLQMQAYQEHMRQQLKSEMEKFQAEQKDIEKNIEEAKKYLAKIESGEDITEEEEVFTDTTDSSLAGLLGITAENQPEYQRLQDEKNHAVAVANQLHQQIQMIMSNQPSVLPPTLDASMLNPSPKRFSPQLPAPVGPFKRHKVNENKNVHEIEIPDAGSLDGLG